MFDLEAQIKEWRAELSRTGIAGEVVDELEGHLQERVDRLKASGCAEPEAFQTAARQLGDGKTIKKEFAKLKRDRLRIFRGNPLGINLLGGWFVFTGLNFLARQLIGLCVHLFQFGQRVLVNYSFKDVGPILPGGFVMFALGIVMLGVWTMTGVGLLKRWKICSLTALWFALPAIYFRIYYDVLGHPFLLPSGRPLPADSTVRNNILGWLPVTNGLYHMFSCMVLVILIWGVCSLLRPWLEKLFRLAVAG